MAWIKEDESYAELPNVIKCMSINPEVMNSVIEMGHNIGFGSSALSRAQEEIIATVVSAINNCEY